MMRYMTMSQHKDLSLTISMNILRFIHHEIESRGVLRVMQLA